MQQHFILFFNKDYKIEIIDNPFVHKDGKLLFGGFQLGGSRYFSNEYPNLGQRIIYPEDCSSAVGKATGFTTQQIINVNTTTIRDAYKNEKNEYNYKAITSSEALDYEKIEQGDIYVRGGHTNIVYNKDNFGNLETFRIC